MWPIMNNKRLVPREQHYSIFEIKPAVLEISGEISLFRLLP